MFFQFPELREDYTAITYGVVGIATAIVVIAKLSGRPKPLDAFPTVGSNSLLDSWYAGFVYLANAEEIIQEGYNKHKSAPFKVADRYSWMVVMSSRKHVEELARAPEDELSFSEAINERTSSEYIMGRELHENPSHVSAIRSHLTRNIGSMYSEIRDEIVTAFDEVLDPEDHQWKSVTALSAIQKIVCRTSNRLFVGLPLCRNPDWIDLNIRYTLDIALAGRVIGLFPKILKPLAVCFFTRLGQGVEHGLKLLRPIIEERLQHSGRIGEKAERLNDLLSWLIDVDPELTVRRLVTRVLAVNFAAIHTSSGSFAHALLYLAANPQFIQPLREEVVSVVEKEGWSKASLAKMHKVDSFLKECQRLEGLFSLSMQRKAMKDYTFADGTFIPRGTLIGVPSRALHYDERSYQNADVFEPFRFAEMREEEREGVMHNFVSTAYNYLAFGHGKHACPGRFFAANELKTMLAHVVVTYDLKLEDNIWPRGLRFGTSIIPNSRATVLFRKRID